MRTLNLCQFLLFFLVACNTSEQSKKPSSSSTSLDPWNAQLGDLVPNALLYDGWYDLRYLPSPVNLDGGWHDSAAITSDGKTLYFSYSRWEFADITDLGTYTMSGPLRDGMSGPELKNFKAELTTNGWTVSYLSTNSSSGINEGAPSVNVAENVLVFVRYTGTKGDIYYSSKDSSGNWSNPLALGSPVNGLNCSNDNPFIVGDLSSGVDIYFESDRVDLACSGGGANKKIYHTFYNPSTTAYSAVQLVPGINGVDPAADEDHQPFVTADKKSFYWTAIRPSVWSIMTADLVGGSYQNVRPVVSSNVASTPYTGKLVAIGEANVVSLPQGYLMYFICGVATRETGKLLGSKLRICRAKKNK